MQPAHRPIDVRTWLSILIVLQMAALALLALRLRGGRGRAPPVPPVREGITDTTVSVLLPTLNAGRRIGPCLAGDHANLCACHHRKVAEGLSESSSAGVICQIFYPRLSKRPLSLRALVAPTTVIYSFWIDA